jgi:multidrug efflux system membrane fusion protein
VDQAAAQVKAAEATVEVYKLNLEFTQVTSPIDGQVSRYFYVVGNLVTQDQTMLTTVVSVDPIYAYFDMDERTILRIRTAINEGKIKAAADRSDIPVEMGLEGEDGFPHRGSLDFVNNVVNPSTGTIAVRGLFPNPKPPNGRRLLNPGMFVRIRLPIGQPHPALLVIDRAVGSDQGLKYVYVVDGENKIQYRRVTLGPLQDDGLRVIDAGLKPDDRVVVGALQQLRPRMDVDPEEGPMPTAVGPPPASGSGQAPVPATGPKPGPGNPPGPGKK